MANANREPDWAVWSNVQVAELWQAVALSLNIEPRKAMRAPHEWKSRKVLFSEAQEFSDRLLVADHNLSRNGPLVPVELGVTRRETLVNLVQFVEWAMSIGWDMPNAMSALSARKPTPSVAEELERASPRATAQAIAAAISARARRAANKGHKEDREMREQAIAWYIEHTQEYANKDKAADAIAGKVVPAKQATVRGWLRNI